MVIPSRARHALRELEPGHIVPPRVLTNADSRAHGGDTSDEWILPRPASASVIWRPAGRLSLAVEARARRSNARSEPYDIDFIVVGTRLRTCCFPAPRASYRSASAPITVATTCCRVFRFTYALTTAAQMVKPAASNIARHRAPT